MSVKVKCLRGLGYSKYPSSCKPSYEIGGRGREMGGPLEPTGFLLQNWGGNEPNHSFALSLRSFVAPVATKGYRDGAMIDQKVEFFLIQPRSPMWRWLSVGQNL
ncbi:uncharacterized protein TNCV_3791051 [Trichonephila clavipes]|nr:uncharacterized protein TNCV_3791051 [Trichonephila clavipes]